MLIIAYFVSLAPPLMIGRLHADHALEDALLMLFFGWLSLKHDRWWLFAMTACVALVVMVHLTMVLAPDLDRRADIAARLGLGVLTMVALLAGVIERWLAGEPPVSAGAQWRRRVRAS